MRDGILIRMNIVYLFNVKNIGHLFANTVLIYLGALCKFVEKLNI